MENRNKRDEAFIKSVNEIIVARLKDEGFGVSELASQMNMSRTTMHRRIKSASGQSVSQFIRNVRLNKAMEQLRNRSITVAEAAYMTGFRSATYFSKCFREYFGYPPVEIIKGTIESSVLKNIKEDDGKEGGRDLLHNFPIQTTSFIGREQEMGIIFDLMEKHKIVTLTGTGGCGKTRLACEIAAQLVEKYPDGIWFVDLAPVETADLVARQLMNTLGLSEIPGKDMVEIVVESIKEKRVLILLDNCEHLLINCAEIARRLTESVPYLSVLATSREAMNIKGEKVWIVPSLTLADPSGRIDIEQVGSSEAVRLFADRARLNNPAFELVEKNAPTVSTICHRVDGIPLAVELVASRTRYLDTMTMLERLSERFDMIHSLDSGIVERHRTIQAAIDWSYKLLLNDEKVLFRRLSVFPGEFDLSDVEEICADKIIPRNRVLDLLSQLVEKSMIQTVYQPGRKIRYKLLETLQRYASHLLAEKGEAEEMRLSHLVYFTELAEQAFDERLKHQQKWIDILNQKHDNIISALNWSDNHSPEYFLRLAGALGWFWRFHSHLVLGCDSLERALAKDLDRSEYYARALYGLGLLLSVTSDAAKAINLLNESLILWRQYGNVEQEAAVLRELIFPYQSIGDEQSSQACGKKCLELAKQTGNQELINHCLGYVCFTYLIAKRFHQVKPLVSELLETSEELNQPDGIVIARHYLGDCALGIKDYQDAERRYARSLENARKYGNELQCITDLQGVAFAVSGQSRWAKSIRLDAAANKQACLSGIRLKGLAGFWDEWIDTYIEGARKKVGEELTRQYEEEGIAMGFEKAVEYAMDFSID